MRFGIYLEIPALSSFKIELSRCMKPYQNGTDVPIGGCLIGEARTRADLPQEPLPLLNSNVVTTLITIGSCNLTLAKACVG